MEDSLERALSQLPSTYKAWFGRQGFVAGRPVLVLSPYDAPHKETRRLWIKEFEDFSREGNLNSLPHLVFQYGSQSLLSAYSLVRIVDVVPVNDETESDPKGDPIVDEGLNDLCRDRSKTPEERRRHHVKLVNEFDRKKEATDIDGLTPGMRVSVLLFDGRYHDATILDRRQDFFSLHYDNGKIEWVPLADYEVRLRAPEDSNSTRSPRLDEASLVDGSKFHNPLMRDIVEDSHGSDYGSSRSGCRTGKKRTVPPVPKPEPRNVKDPPSSPPVKKRKKPRRVSVEVTNSSNQVSTPYSIQGQTLLAAKMEDKTYSLSEQDEILSEVPHLKEMLGQVGFVQYQSAGYMPVLVLSPFLLPPGQARDLWLQKYEKAKARGKLHRLHYLVYWYGTMGYNNCDCAIAFVKRSSFVSLEEGEAEGYCTISDTIQKKLDAGKKLKPSEREKYEAIEEMKADLESSPLERLLRKPWNSDENGLKQAQSETAAGKLVDENALQHEGCEELARSLKLLLEKEIYKASDVTIRRCRSVLDGLEKCKVTSELLEATLVGKTVAELKDHSVLGPMARRLNKKWNKVRYDDIVDAQRSLLVKWRSAVKEKKIDVLQSCMENFLSMIEKHDTFRKALFEVQDLETLMHQTGNIILQKGGSRADFKVLHRRMSVEIDDRFFSV